MKIITKNQKAFTLLEMTIALGIFVILFTLTLGIYSYAIKAQQKALQMSKLQREAQLFMEIMAKKVRSSRIDYDFYGGSVDPTNGETELALLDNSNNPTVFRITNEGYLESCIENCGTQNYMNDESFFSLPSSDVAVDEMMFYIEPSVNPFDIESPPSQFPQATIMINLKNSSFGNEYNLRIQQTIPQRLPGI